MLLYLVVLRSYQVIWEPFLQLLHACSIKNIGNKGEPLVVTMQKIKRLATSPGP